MSEVRISGASANARNESDISLFHGDPAKVIGATNEDVTFLQVQCFSSDGGASWNQTTLPLVGTEAFQSDPAVDWTFDGTAWALTLGIDGFNVRVRAYSSTDGGATWVLDGTPSGAQTGTDREIMWIDHSPTSPFKDQIYTIYHNGAPAFVARRTSGAAGAWQAPVQVSGAETTGTAIGADIKCNAFGDVFAFWPDAAGSNTLFVAKSTNGGANFGAPVAIANAFLSSRIVDIPAAPRAGGGRGARLYVSAGAYRTAAKDMVYAVWTDLSGAAGCTTGNGPGTNTASTCKSRIWFSRSVDGGATWSAATMLNNQAGLNDQFHSRLCVDESNGNLIVTYLDTVNDANRVAADLWMQTSTDDGVTWSAATQITTVNTNETVAGANLFQYGDYQSLNGFYGIFYPTWTRRSAGVEETWTAQVSIVQKQCFFIVDKSTFGQDEVTAMVTSGQTTVDAAFYVVVEGFSASELGITAPDLVGAPTTKPALTTIPAVVSGMTIGQPTALLAEDPSLPATPQRFTWVYPITFIDASAFTQPTVIVTLNASMSTVAGSAQIQLLQQLNPYELDGQTSWLSTDLRVFHIKDGESKFAATVNGSAAADAIDFIRDVLTNLNPGGNSGGQTFDSDLDPNATELALNQVDAGGTAIFNFAVAKVRYRAVSQDAQAVRVFFRLCPALTVSTAYDSNATYRTFSDGVQFGQKIARLGRQNNNILTIPCFATGRVTPGASMDTQPDPPNVMTIAHDASGVEVDRYFGCWLDINQPGQQHFPLNPTDEGPYSGSLKSVLELVRNQHQCLLAEIAFDPVAIPPGSTAGTSDKLAQRNLSLVTSSNPGDVASRRIPNTFELKPTVGAQGLQANELMIDWGNTPSGSFARIYLPTVSIDEILELAAKRYNPASFKRIDDHTIEVLVQDVTYIPIPTGSPINHTGLITVDLPPGIKKGQKFEILMRQFTPTGRQVVTERQVFTEVGAVSKPLNWRRVVGTFQISIPVTTKELMLESEERLLSILRWILLSIPAHDRWYPVFKRYVDQIADRVRGLGGDPNLIGASPTGQLEPGKAAPPRPRPEERVGHTGKIAGLIFDHFGDFEGFVLETNKREHRFFSREKDMEELAERVWFERLRITVWTERDHPHRPLTITVHQPPAQFKLPSA